MEKLKHFWHRHPLGLKELQKDEGGHKLVICGFCAKQILGPAYSCSECDFFLHKRCAALRPQVTDPIHQHPMHVSWPFACDFCLDDREGHCYRCFSCEFNICISCLLEDRRMITHKIHEHPLAFLLRSTSFFCNLCRMEHKDSSYVCVTCQFWIHKRCALLPTTISRTDHHHPLILEKLDKFTQFDTDCYICDERINRFYWAYYCFRCRCSIHVKCSSTSSSTPLRDLESEIMDQKDHDLDVLHLPMNCFVEHLLLEKIEDEPMISHRSHEHQLTLFKVQNDNETNNDNTILCDSCVQPISHPFYRCTQCVYFLHLTNTRFSSQTVVNSICPPIAKLASHTTTVSSTSVTRVNTSPLMLNVLSCPPLLYMKLTSTPYVRLTIQGMSMDLAGHVDSIFIITGSDVRIAISVYAVIVFYSLKPSSIDGIDIPSSLPILLSLIIPKISIVKFARKK
ncbi:unnamed protein product [Ilex paraguariensis]|uniref:Phorbol-ester/DAG-type domain-containing protein n=1 Tax=Ilex paraguariensis TaxID=185542 RepID=A0ABC8SHU6_9AQUA